MRAFGRPASRKSSVATVVFIFVYVYCAAIALHAQTLTTLHSFSGSDGMNPYREALVQGADGNFYGTTENGGTGAFGLVFKMAPDGTITPFHEFVGTDGEYPSSGLVQDAAGNFYGTARAAGPGGFGEVYKITPQGTFSVVHGFTGSDGGVVYAPPLVAIDGTIYGVTTNDGGLPSSGTAYKVGRDGSNFTVLHTFCSLTNCADGGHPLGGMAEGPDHNLYGTTQQGGTLNFGTVYRVTPGGTYTVLHNFDDANDGRGSRGKMIVASDGFLYGTTYVGGAGGHGTVFKIKPDGTNFSTVFAFCLNQNCSAGRSPEAGVIQASDGNFYGCAGAGGNGSGTVYRLTPNGQATALHDFTGADGSNPYCDLLQASDGFLYGTTYIGGGSNDGTVFKVTGPPVISTTTTLTTAPNPSHQNQTVTMTAAVHAQNGLTPSGTVIFKSDGVQIGAAILSGGVAALNYSSLSIGTHSIVAVYQGGGGFAGSTSNTVQQVVQLPLSTTTVTSAPNPSTGGDVVTITATIGPAGPPTPTGTVGFASNGTVISGCSAVIVTSQVAVCTTAALAVGTDAIVATYSGDSNYVGSSGSVTQIVNPVPAALQFKTLPPCRVVDTRHANGTFGGPAISGNSARAFPLSLSGNPCAIPSTAVAYSLNVTVVPVTTLSYLTIWPSGEGQPTVSTLNSLDGRLKANAVIIPAGSPNGSVSVFVTNTTNVIIDINGYFEPSSGSTLAFYPLSPCRIADTRHANGPLGGPSLTGGQERDFPVLQSSCALPLTGAAAYSLNFTVIPKTSRGVSYLTVWPQGSSRPLVSTLNDLTNTVVANAAIVPAGTDGGVATFSSDDTDLVIDVNGYFAPPGSGGLSFYALTPCRVIDTRSSGGQPFSGELTVNVVDSPCGPPDAARGYVFNATVVPNGSLSFLTLWPDTEEQPGVSTLNAIDHSITSNMAIVPNINGKTDAYAAGSTQLILDISGYFAP